LVMATKSGTTIESVQSLFAQIDDLAKNPISQEEIKTAKDGILNSFVFNFDSPDKVLRERMAYEFYGYPPDFLERYRAGIEKVGPADVARAAAKYLHKDQLAVLVVGNPAEFDKPLSTLGPVAKVDISIPPPPAEKSAPSEEKPTASNAEGKALAAKVVEAMGGLEKLQAVKSMRVSFTESQAGGAPSPVTLTVVLPDRMHVDVQTAQGNLAIVVTPEAGFMSAAGLGVRNLPPEQKADAMTQIHHDPVYLAQHLNDPAFSFHAGGTEKIGDVEARIVEVDGAAPWIRWYVDPKTGRVLREAYKGLGQSGPFDGETDLSDWKTVDGLTFPYLHRNRQDGKDSSVVKYDTIQINPAIDPKLFERPPGETAPAQ
jgi:zinc protease